MLPVRSASADAETPAQALKDAQALFQARQYFKSARYAFAASEGSSEPEADSWITVGLAKAGLYNAASYFFIRTLQSGNKPAIRRVLGETQNLLVFVGTDLLRKYLIRHTSYEDYDGINRSAYLYALGKDALLSGSEERAIGYLNGIHESSPVWPFALQLRASAYAIQGKSDQALHDFRECADKADRIARPGLQPTIYGRIRTVHARREADDLEARCIAGQARTLYQMEQFDDADRTYDQIQKASIIWPDILFEQAWNSFARQEYNRTLGKLVSYKSPALSFVFNSEVDVLRAQSFLALCLYNDANQAINDFHAEYSKVGEEVKDFVESHASDLMSFYQLGKGALKDSLYTKNAFHRMVNRFVRGPYFQNMVTSEREVAAELASIRQWDAQQQGAEKRGKGFTGFLDQVLTWRLRTIRLLGGVFVKNSLLDYHSALLSDFEKMAFIKLEMLKLAKEKLIYKEPPGSDRTRGNLEPSRRDYQYYWSFNGEFWNDELGDYVFGLESECK